MYNLKKLLLYLFKKLKTTPTYKIGIDWYIKIDMFTINLSQRQTLV